MRDIAVAVSIALHTALGIAAGATAATTAAVGEIVGLLIGLPGLGGVISGTATSTVVAALTETTARLDLQIAQGNFNAGVLICSAIDSLWKIPGMSQLVAEIEYLVLDSKLPKKSRNLHYLVTSGTRADSDQKDFVSDSLEVVFRLSGFSRRRPHHQPVLPAGGICIDALVSRVEGVAVHAQRHELSNCLVRTREPEAAGRQLPMAHVLPLCRRAP
jgi:hypothetical protein